MQTNFTYDMYVPTHVIFGAGMLGKLSEQPMPGKKALIVISNGKSNFIASSIFSSIISTISDANSSSLFLFLLFLKLILNILPPFI